MSGTGCVGSPTIRPPPSRINRTRRLSLRSPVFFNPPPDFEKIDLGLDTGLKLENYYFFTFLLFLGLKLENYYFFTFLLFLDLKLENYYLFTFLLFLGLKLESYYLFIFLLILRQGQRTDK